MHELIKIGKEITFYATSKSKQTSDALQARAEIEEKINKILDGVFPNQQDLWINTDKNYRVESISMEVRINIFVKVKKDCVEEVRKKLNKLEKQIMEKYSS
ncbi:hypothetical protein [Acinetobacter venetianus]|uniref:hypothetical protein n=1 Tax=Acinetobacter venetianus TaxID=52133 RepID=UPI00241E0C83|nr:hypothetical protein [Acinetobacter venetianus]